MVLAYVHRVAQPVLRDLASSGPLLSVLLVTFGLAVGADTTGAARRATSTGLAPGVLVGVALVVTVAPAVPRAAIPITEGTVERYVAPRRAQKLVSEFWVAGS